MAFLRTKCTAVSLTDVSKTVSHALRHEPWLYELELDEEGWAPLAQLLLALRSRGGAWAGVDRAHIETMTRDSAKERHELRGDFIRAKYGHSLPGRLVRTAAEPPEVLLHGTSPELVNSILNLGLLPMGRQYVHLSVDRETAWNVGRRKHEQPMVLRVEARRAHTERISFYRGNEHVWLARPLPQ